MTASTHLVRGEVGVPSDDLLILSASVTHDGQAVNLAVDATAATLPDPNLKQVVELKGEKASSERQQKRLYGACSHSDQPDIRAGN